MWTYTRKDGRQRTIEVDPQRLIRMHLVGEEGPSVPWEAMYTVFGPPCNMSNLGQIRNSPEWVREIQRYIEANDVTGDTEWLYQKLVPNYRAWVYTQRDGKRRTISFNPQSIIRSRHAHGLAWSDIKSLYGSVCNAQNLSHLKHSPEWRAEVERYLRLNKVDPEDHYAIKWDLIANYRENID